MRNLFGGLRNRARQIGAQLAGGARRIGRELRARVGGRARTRPTGQ